MARVKNALGAFGPGHGRPGSGTGPAVAADDSPAYGPQLQGFDYPWPVSHFSFTSQGNALDMAYMDVKPAMPNGKTVVLLHGKNFCAATWQDTIALLSQQATG